MLSVDRGHGTVSKQATSAASGGIMARQRKTRLTVYLVKDGVPWKEVTDPDDKVLTFKIGQRAELVVRPSRSTPPSWVRFFDGKVDTRGLQSFTASSAALLRVEHEGRIFGLSFGQGRHLLRDGVIEPAFGLRVVLNAIDPNRIRTLDRDSLDVVGRRTREQVSKEDSIQSFLLNVDQDLVRAVTGGATEKDLGERLTGADALFLTVPNTLSTLPSLLTHCLTLYKSKAYRNSFDWVDHISPVRDPALLERLDRKIVEHLRARNADRTWLAVPEIIDWSHVAGFKYGGWYDRDLVDDIYMPEFLERYPSLSTLSIDVLQRLKVSCINSETNRPSHTWRLYKCLYGEVEDHQRTYLLNSGEWYRVDEDFIANVDRDVRKLMTAPSRAGNLPPYRDQSEGHYNERACREDRKRLALMDRKLIPYSGRHSKLEFCDIFTAKKAICHIKRYGGSNVLSHLFAQGVVSAEAFAHDAGFRAKVNAQLPARFKIPNPEGPIDPADYEVVFGIVSKAPQDLRLPFFSRVTLRNAYRRLNAMRYRTSVVKIAAS